MKKSLCSGFGQVEYDVRPSLDLYILGRDLENNFTKNSQNPRGIKQYFTNSKAV